MRHLAIESSGQFGSLAVFRDKVALTIRELPNDIGTVQSLAPGIADIIGSAQPEFITVSQGPGSFTGLRIGIVTAKMLGMAWGIPLVPIDTLEVIAFAAAEKCQAGQIVIPVLNAFRGQVFSAAWKVKEEQSANSDPSPIGPSRLQRLTPTQVLDAEPWCETPLQTLGLASDPTQTSIVIVGAGLEKYQPNPSLIASELVRLASPEIWKPSASNLAILGFDKFQRGQTVSPVDLMPNYVRESAAEEKLRG